MQLLRLYFFLPDDVLEVGVLDPLELAAEGARGGVPRTEEAGDAWTLPARDDFLLEPGGVPDKNKSKEANYYFPHEKE